MRFFRFIKIEHTLFSLPIVFSGTLLLSCLNPHLRVTPLQLFLILIAAFTARSAGFGFNRIVDYKIDAQNPRTKNREIPAGIISLKEAWFFVISMMGIFFIAAYLLSSLCLLFAPIPMILFYIYPFLKRCTLWTHLGLGIAWGIAPIGGWFAIRPQVFPFVDLSPLLLLAAFCVFWVAGFDILYALLDEDFDRQNHIYSMPAQLGKTNAIRVAQIFHFIAFLILGIIMIYYVHYFVAHLIYLFIGLLFILSHWKILKDGVTPETIDFAFFKSNALMGFLIFILFALEVKMS